MRRESRVRLWLPQAVASLSATEMSPLESQRAQAAERSDPAGGQGAVAFHSRKACISPAAESLLPLLLLSLLPSWRRGALRGGLALAMLPAGAWMYPMYPTLCAVLLTPLGRVQELGPAP